MTIMEREGGSQDPLENNFPYLPVSKKIFLLISIFTVLCVFLCLMSLVVISMKTGRYPKLKTLIPLQPNPSLSPNTS